MSNGFFVQGVAVLFEQAPFDPDLQLMLAPLGAFPREGTAQNLHAISWVIPFRPDVGGFILIDVLPRPWPDTMGDQEIDPVTFLAWGAGAFGPGAWPGGLQRAVQGAPEKEATSFLAHHHGVVRIRLTYVLEEPRLEAPFFPQDRDSVAELKAILDVAAVLLQWPTALAFYNPNAERIVSPSLFDKSYKTMSQNKLPWPLIVSIRNLPLNPTGRIFDTLGLRSQWEASLSPLLDHEVVSTHDLDPVGTDRFLRGLAATAITRGSDWQPGDEVEGPGDRLWKAERHAEALLVPPRPVWRWSPS